MAGTVPQAEYASLEKQRFALTQKRLELVADQRETELVLGALKEADKSRRCMRMVGGVLIERTVGEVEGALGTHNQHLASAIEALDAQIDKINKEVAELATKLGLNIATNTTTTTTEEKS